MFIILSFNGILSFLHLNNFLSFKLHLSLCSNYIGQHILIIIKQCKTYHHLRFRGKGNCMFFLADNTESYKLMNIFSFLTFITYLFWFYFKQISVLNLCCIDSNFKCLEIAICIVILCRVEEHFQYQSFLYYHFLSLNRVSTEL